MLTFSKQEGVRYVSNSSERILYRNCPLCDSANFLLHASANCSLHKLYDPIIPSQINWMKCDDCAHVFTDGYFSHEQNEVLFSKAHLNQLPGQNVEQGRLLSAKIVETVLGSPDVLEGVEGMFPRFSGKNSWLDIGFGDGTLLMTAQEYGLTVAGIDVRKQAVDELLKFGIDARVGTPETAARELFSVVSLADVLEHIPFPKLALSAVRENLIETNGLLFVSCPNMDTAAWRYLTAIDANPYWIEIEHFHNFTRKRLESVLHECGFQPIDYSISERYRLGMEIIARAK